MSKRVVAVPLWFLTGWMVAAMVAFVLGMPSWIAPATAVSVAVVVALDPAGWFWPRSPAAASGVGPEAPPAILSALGSHLNQTDSPI